MTVLPISAEAISQAVAQALREDAGAGDLTADLIPSGATGHARVSARESCILCGTAWFDEVFRQLDTDVAVRWHGSDGEAVAPGTDICSLRGSATALLTGERTALNFLQTLSATATAARRYVDAVVETGATILDTRKTIPGLRDAQKYAVRCGGARNHRHGLYDAILVKENHIAAAGGLRQAVESARHRAPSVLLIVEVENLGQLREVLACRVDRVLLDNFSLEEMRQAVKERDAHEGNRVALEASGSVDLDGVRETARTGVDFISVGALTKHVRAVDFSMRFV
ncbi:MAG: carboxylating nicotinate-nucleotide diphosphorylase [Proteobacteria bacterium]|nr:carboxylating nicotinate-nucleotide diphosphorylase [Pseudomonadota bacterium]MYJ96200.1 carboxylating nicotinate-nucleotide diphosphorylase [Pseudomonadota bacterium]